MVVFIVKKGTIAGNHPWQERKDIIFRAKFGIFTHRCHKREFLLKFSKDRHRWLQWLYEARKRYDLTILNYTVTWNHIHLLVMDDGKRDVIPKSIQLVARRTGQEYNQRKKRKGAFWEDRYHGTAVETGEHLLRCVVYIDFHPVK